MPELFTAPDVIRRRVAIFASRLECDPDRIIGWALAQAVLATIWSVQDGEPVDATHPFLRFARSARTLF
jgi:streptomycin 6-kinase